MRSRIFQQHLNNPAYYDRMSKLLEEIIADLRTRRVDYEAYLLRIAELARRVQHGQEDDTPDVLKHQTWLRALYDNLKAQISPMNADAAQEPRPAVFGPVDDATLALAVAIDETVRRVRPDDWRGNQARENEIKRALLPLLNNDAQEVERVFLIVKAQREY